ncbi:MAG: alpha/beta hydrolase [Actinomycetota bacterium]|nr:alpha/beta hydrolase [Actinomycetota bacterium]MDH4353412.1 alpha/beta hydrolase [Actinomycetota bacterium]
MSSVTYRVPQLVLTEHTFPVPLDHADPTGEQIDVFAREVVAADKEGADLPWLVFLQGGPGFEAPRPRLMTTPPWLERALTEFRVLMLDQRGVGRSSPVGPRDVDVHDPAGLASRLVHFRADAIVRDAERVRRQLGVGSWSVLGQSFGGFCVVTYLSLHPESLDLALVTGGLPPLDRSIDEVYAATYQRTAAKVAAHYERFPEDRGRVEQFVHELATHDVRLPDGSRLSHRRFRQLGMMLGMSDGSEKLHAILELPTDSPAFRHDVAASLPFARNPLYAVVHESCYASGQVTDWSAQRVLPHSYADDPALLTGEHVYPWMFDEDPGLQPFAETAELLAAHAWGPLYDVERLATNDVPSAALVYADDMYVERDFSEETAAGIRGLRMWLTNEYEHDGLRADGARVLGRLLDLARGRA